jgi:hypothetical protein
MRRPWRAGRARRRARTLRRLAGEEAVTKVLATIALGASVWYSSLSPPERASQRRSTIGANRKGR